MNENNKIVPTSSIKRRERISNCISYAVLIIISIIWLLPFFMLVCQSFISREELMSTSAVYVIPKAFSLDNYRFLLSSESGFVRWYGNTLIIAIFVSAIQTAVVLCVAYALSRLRFKGRTFLMKFWLILGMFPGFLTMICLYFILREMGLTQAGAIPGLILIGTASSGMGYYVCKGFFDTIPKALDEAARIDGASRARIFFVITMPMSKPILIYTALVAFMGPWCDYVFASYVAFAYSKSYNVAVGLQSWVWSQEYSGYFTRFCAGGILVAVPVTILFMLLQKYYVEGVTGGAVKG